MAVRAEGRGRLVDFLRQLDPDVPVMALGLGSNMIVRDSGVPGVVVRLGKAFSKIDRIDDTTLRCGGGASGILVSSTARDAGIAGLEIPSRHSGHRWRLRSNERGRLRPRGGGILVEARVALRDGTVESWPLEKLGYTYRHSEVPGGAVVVEATFEARLASLRRSERRWTPSPGLAKNPSRSASRTGGSTFKNPPATRPGCSSMRRVAVG
jgi:UDP-N-acetylmuramate dehydrogenase